MQSTLNPWPHILQPGLPDCLKSPVQSEGRVPGEIVTDKVRDYVLSSGTKTFKTSVKTDLEVARPLLQSMHKMHRAGVDNYVTHTGRIRKLTPKECLRLMGFRDDFKQVVSDTQMYRQAGNSIVVDVLISLLKQMDITKFAK